MILAWSLAAAPPVWYIAFWLVMLGLFCLFMLWRDWRSGR